MTRGLVVWIKTASWNIKIWATNSLLKPKNKLLLFQLRSKTRRLIPKVTKKVKSRHLIGEWAIFLNLHLSLKKLRKLLLKCKCNSIQWQLIQMPWITTMGLMVSNNKTLMTAKCLNMQRDGLTNALVKRKRQKKDSHNNKQNEYERIILD